MTYTLAPFTPTAPVFGQLARHDILVVPRRADVPLAYRAMRKAQPTLPDTEVCIVWQAVAAQFVRVPAPVVLPPPVPCQLALFGEGAV